MDLSHESPAAFAACTVKDAEYFFSFKAFIWDLFLSANTVPDVE